MLDVEGVFLWGEAYGGILNLVNVDGVESAEQGRRITTRPNCVICELYADSARSRKPICFGVRNTFSFR